jgi:hypothetical protein
MTRYYSEPERENDPYSLPNVEVFYRDGSFTPGDAFSPEYNDGEALGAGWFYWFCLPGCLPDSDPMGPYDTEGEALQAARDDG